MFKKSALSVAVASALVLAGCGSNDSSSANAGATNVIEVNPGQATSENRDFAEVIAGFEGRTWPTFNPVTSDLPIPNDLIFDSAAGDGTFAVSDTQPPVTTALNEISGASTVAPIDIRIEGTLDESSVDGALVALPGIPNPNQNVFLLELVYASGDPVTGLSGQEAPTVYEGLMFGAANGNPSAIGGYAAVNGIAAGAAQAAATAEIGQRLTDPDYVVTVEEFDSTSYIRINLMKPLNPRSRYLVVIADDILDVNGDQIVQSPSYLNITDTDFALPSTALDPVRAVVNGLWEPSALGYFTAVANTARPGAELGVENIAMSYSFTTSDDAQVLDYIAEPGSWVADRLEDLVKNTAAATAIAGGASDFGTILTEVTTAYAAWLPSSVNGALAPCDAAPAGAARFTCAGDNLVAALEAGLLPGGLTVDFPDPTGAATAPSFTSQTNALQVSALLSPILGANPANVFVAQGSMSIPYYLGVPNGTDGSPLTDSNWLADDVLATQLNGVFASAGLNIPQADSSVSTAVNYIFPFPKKSADVDIPVLVMYPGTSATDGTPAGPISKTVIFQHGITTDRSASLAFGTALVAGLKGLGQDVAVVAIDQPLHGVSAFTEADQLDLAQTLLTVGGQDPANAQAVVDGTFSVGYLVTIDPACSAITITDPSDATQIQTATGIVLTGGCDGDVAGAAATLGGALVLESTVANAGSTVAGLARTDDERHFDFKANAAARPVDMDTNVTTDEGESGSLFLNLTNFLASRDNLRQQVLDLLELRLSLGTFDLNDDSTTDIAANPDVYFIGHSLGTVNGMPFVGVTSRTATTDDDITASNMLTPGGGLTRLIENSQSFAPRVLAGLAAAAGIVPGDSSLEAYLNVFQATVDTVDPMNFMERYEEDAINALFTEVVGDTTIPNSAWPDPVLTTASASNLAGTEPLIRLSNATVISGAGANAFAGPAGVRYTEGFHGTPAYPSSGTAEETAAFAEMVAQAVSIVASSGTGITITNDAVIQ